MRNASSRLSLAIVVFLTSLLGGNLGGVGCDININKGSVVHC